MTGKKDNTAVLSDEKLVEMARSGSEDAINQLIFRYAPIVRSRTSVYYGTELSAEDLAQEGTIGLLGAIKRYESGKGASFKTFAILCIDRSIIDAVRSILYKANKSSVVTISLDEELTKKKSEVLDVECISAEDEAFENNLKSEYNKLFDEILSEQEKNILILRMGGCSYADIASRFDTTSKSIEAKLYRIRKKLKERLN